MPREIGTVICTHDGPSASEFSFVVTARDRPVPVRRGQFVELQTEEGRAVAWVESVMKTNRYFMRPDSVGEYERGGKALTSIFPADRWEYIVARARVSGIQTGDGLEQVSFPASPGQRVYEANSGILTKFLGFDGNSGVELGRLRYHDLPVRLNLTKLLRKHVAILAMSGAGKCLSYESPVFLANGELRPIGELVDSAFERAKEKKLEDGIEYVTQNPDDLEVLTLAPRMRIERARVRAFMRRKFGDKLLKVRTRSGKELHLTPDHPLLTIECGKPRWKKAEELKEGGRIAVPRQVRIRGEPQTIDLAEIFRERDDVWAFDVGETLDSLLRGPVLSGKTLKEIARRFDISYSGFKHRLNSGNLPLKQLNYLVKLAGSATPEVEKVGLRWSKPIDAKVTVDEDFARFLAYLFAEGHNNGKVLSFTNSAPRLLNDFTYLSEKIFGIKPLVIKREGSQMRVIPSKSAAFAVEKVFQVKGPAAEKRIPEAIMRSPDSVIRGYLRVLFDCDGYCDKRKGTVSIALSNPDNALRIEAMLLRLGITSRIKERTRKVRKSRRNYWYIYIRGAGNLRRFAERVGFTVVKKADRLREHLKLKPNSNLDLVPAVGGRIKSLCRRLKISYEELERRSVMSSSVSRYAAGQMDPSRESLLKITRGLRDRLGELTQDLPESELLTTADEVARVQRGKLLGGIRGLASSFTKPCAGIDRSSGFCRGITYEYPAGIRRSSYPALLGLFDGLGAYVESNGELNGAESEIAELEELATSHIFWDKVVSVEKSDLGGYVYDLSVHGSHNFIAGNVIVHNSYSATVLIEELLERAKKEGRVASIVIDAHGEYSSLASSPGTSSSEESGYSGRASVVKGKDIQIGVPNLSAYRFREFAPDMSGSQVRELARVIRGLRAELRSGGGPYDLDNIIKCIKENGNTHGGMRQALLDRLYDLRFLGLFGKNDYPGWEGLVRPGRAVILDLSDILNLRKKQVIVTYLARKLFNARKASRAPPFVLFLEEAHQFAPSKEAAISSSIIRTIAREGRKFYASLVLISQRPVRLSTTVLSQANTNIILRVTNPYDLDHIKQSSERITRDTVDVISSLPVGEALIVGEAVNHPVFIKIRERRSRGAPHGAALEEVARRFEHRSSQKRKDAEAFM